MPINADTTDTIAIELTRITDELTAAQADVAILERLRGAEARVKVLTSEHVTASAKLALQMTEEAKAQLDARFDYLGDISVRDMKPEEQVIGSSFQIICGKLSWDMYLNKSVMQDETFTGFECLPTLILEYLIEKHPSQIPHKIAALATDPRAAFDRYFLGMRRGYLASDMPETTDR